MFHLSVCLCISLYFMHVSVYVLYSYLCVFELRVCELSSLCGILAFLLALCWHIGILQTFATWVIRKINDKEKK